MIPFSEDSLQWIKMEVKTLSIKLLYRRRDFIYWIIGWEHLLLHKFVNLLWCTKEYFKCYHFCFIWVFEVYLHPTNYLNTEDSMQSFELLIRLNFKQLKKIENRFTYCIYLNNIIEISTKCCPSSCYICIQNRFCFIILCKTKFSSDYPHAVKSSIGIRFRILWILSSVFNRSEGKML